jgi:hypothetical protein
LLADGTAKYWIALEESRATIGLKQTQQQLSNGGLTAATLAYQRQRTPCIDSERNTIHRGNGYPASPGLANTVMLDKFTRLKQGSIRGCYRSG